MKKITGLIKGRGRSTRLYLDGRYLMNLESDLVLKAGLEVGQELSAEQIEILKKDNEYEKCLEAALTYLDYRPRSEKEVHTRLIKRGFNDNDIRAVIDNLKKQGFLDDGSFARFWKDNRQSFNPRSRKLTEMELRQKGVSREIIEQELNNIDDAENAYRAAEDHVRRLASSDYQAFRRRLGEYLKRRGFSYDVINTAIMRLWQEREGSRIDD